MTTRKAPPADPANAPADPVVDLYSGEFGDTLNGFDEVAIVGAFGKSLDQLGQEGGMMGVRSLVFAHRRREGDKDRDAKKYAMDLPRAEVAAYFAGLGNRPDETDDAEGKG